MTRFCWRDGTGCPSSHPTKPRRTRRGARRVGTARDRAALEAATEASRPARDSLASARCSRCPAEGCSPGPWCVSVAFVASCGDYSDSRHPVPPGESTQFGITHLARGGQRSDLLHQAPEVQVPPALDHLPVDHPEHVHIDYLHSLAGRRRLLELAPVRALDRRAYGDPIAMHDQVLHGLEGIGKPGEE